MAVPLCEHVRIGGARCGSPALRGLSYCYYHAPGHAVAPRLNPLLKRGHRSPAGEFGYNYSFPYAEDTAAIQLGFTRLVRALWTGRINPRCGRLMLDALRGAALNLRHGRKTGGSAREDSRSCEHAPAKGCRDKAGVHSARNERP